MFCFLCILLFYVFSFIFLEGHVLLILLDSVPVFFWMYLLLLIFFLFNYSWCSLVCCYSFFGLCVFFLTCILVLGSVKVWFSIFCVSSLLGSSCSFNSSWHKPSTWSQSQKISFSLESSLSGLKVFDLY